MKDVSIVISTRNRAEMLERTLMSFKSVAVPERLRVEMIVVDNGSTDHTERVIHNAAHPSMEIRYLRESRPGKSRALNLAIKAAKGRVLLFTDDDVEPADNWIGEMSRPLLEGRCEALTGIILLGRDLQRTWMTPIHRVFLAWISDPAEVSPDLVGANMGLRKEVFDSLGPFDENLGPGASGFGEEALLCRQMGVAGMHIQPVRTTHVVHYPESSRLLRRSWISAAERIGASEAYVLHHWEHGHITFPALRHSLLRVKLWLRLRLQGGPDAESEGCPIWEICYRMRIATLAGFKREFRKPRAYSLRGVRQWESIFE